MDSETTKETQTPEGATAEQVAVAEAALALLPADDEPPTDGLEREKDKLVGDITGLRSQKRRLKAEIAAADSRSEPAEVQKEAEPSPLDKFVAEHPEDIVPGTVHKAERDFQEKKRKVEAAKKASESRKSERQNRTNSAIKRARAKYADFTDVTETGEELLTPGDVVDIQAEAEPEDLLYKKCIARILEAGGPEGDKLKARLRKVAAKKKVETESASTETKNKSGGSEEKPKASSPHIERMRRLLG